MFSLRQRDTAGSTTYQIQNTNIRSSAALLQRLEELREGAPGSVSRYIAYAEMEKKKHNAGGRLSTATEVCSGIEYLYMAVVALARDRRMTPGVVKMLNAARIRDPASLLLSELVQLAVRSKAKRMPAAEECSAASPLPLDKICEDVLNFLHFFI